MDQRTQFVGIDLHQETVTLAVLEEGAPSPRDVQTLPNDPSKLRRYIARVAQAGPVRACYEASACGYVLQRSLTRWGHACEVIAPSLIPRRPGARLKTDRRDAARLAHLYRSGELTAVRVPTEEEERLRSLVRCREALVREVLASRHHVLKLLQGRGQRYEGKEKWTAAYQRWLDQIDLPEPDAYTLRTYRALLETKIALREEVGRKIEAFAQLAPWKDVVARLVCLRGVRTVTAMTLALEIGDVTRFATARHLMAWLGLNVSEYSSGSQERRGGITKAGNGRCRRILVEAAWHYRHEPRVRKALEDRRRGADPLVVAHADRAQRRLCRRFKDLEARMPSAKAVVAVARELAGFVWALMHEGGRRLQP